MLNGFFGLDYQASNIVFGNIFERKPKRNGKQAVGRESRGQLDASNMQGDEDSDRQDTISEDSFVGSDGAATYLAQIRFCTVAIIHQWMLTPLKITFLPRRRFSSPSDYLG